MGQIKERKILTALRHLNDLAAHNIDRALSWTNIKSITDRKVSFLSLIIFVAPIFLKFVSLGDRAVNWIDQWVSMQVLQDAVAEYKGVLLASYFGAVLLVVSRLLFGIFAPAFYRKFDGIDAFFDFFLKRFWLAKKSGAIELRDYYLQQINAFVPCPPGAVSRSHIQEAEISMGRPYRRWFTGTLAYSSLVLLIVGPAGVFFDMVKKAIEPS